MLNTETRSGVIVGYGCGYADFCSLSKKTCGEVEEEEDDDVEDDDEEEEEEDADICDGGGRLRRVLLSGKN